MLSSIATTETNEQKEVRIVVPPEEPHDTRICIEDLVDMEIDQLKDDEKKGKQPGIGTPEPVEMKEKCKERVSTFDMQNLCTKRDGIIRRNHLQPLGSKRHPSRKRVLQVVLSRA